MAEGIVKTNGRILYMAGSGNTEWGKITGNIQDQEDLKEVLDGKQDKLTAGTNITINEDNVISTVDYKADYGLTKNSNNVFSKNDTFTYAMNQQTTNYFDLGLYSFDSSYGQSTIRFNVNYAYGSEATFFVQFIRAINADVAYAYCIGSNKDIAKNYIKNLFIIKDTSTTYGGYKFVLKVEGGRNNTVHVEANYGADNNPNSNAVGKYSLGCSPIFGQSSDPDYYRKVDVIYNGGGGSSYTAGTAINLNNNAISVNVGKGLETDEQNNLQVKLGKGLKFDTDAGVEGEISIDDIGQEVIDEVLELSSELDKKITTTFNYAQITSAEDFAPFGVSGTTRMIGQLFAVPISSEIRENDTLICIRAKQNYSGKVSFGIFEFDFDGNDGSGSTTWLCDTGVVSIKEGENQLPVKHIIPTSTVRPVIKMEPGKLYYATVMIANDAPATGLYLASCPSYDQNYNATPKYTMVVSNMDSYVDWTIGTQRNTWFQGYNEFNNVPRLFMMIRNGEAAPVPTIEPFTNFSSFTLEHQYRINDLFSLSFNVTNQPVLYQKIRPAQDCIITKIGWVDYHSGATYADATDIPLMIDDNYTSMTTFGDNVETSAGTKIDDVHYYHEFELSNPINLQADTNYFVPCNMKISGADTEWVITYSSPSGTSKDLILFDSKYNVASWAGNHAQYLSSQPGTFCRIFTDDGKNYTF